MLPLLLFLRRWGRQAAAGLLLLLPTLALAQAPPCSPGQGTAAVNTTPFAKVTQQSFTATCTGKLTTLTIAPSNFCDDIRGSGYSVIPRIKDATGTTTLAQLPRTDQYYPSTTAAPLSFDFSGANVVLTAGTQYRWEFECVENNGGAAVELILADVNTTNPYAGGQLYEEGVAKTGRDALKWNVNLVAAVQTGIISGAPFCAGSSVAVPFTAYGTIGSGNVYTAQLSNASGSFSAPTTIGTLSSTASSGTITATLPAGAGTGTGYRIRVVASTTGFAAVPNTSDLTINATPNAPTGAASQSFSSGGATVANLAATGSNIQWYATSTGGSPLASTTALTNGTTYYATQTVSGCESTSRLAVTATVTSPVTTPSVSTGTAGSLTSSGAVISNNSLTASGGAALTDYGVVYVAGSGTPTTSNSKVQAGTSSPGSFPSSYNASLTGLAASTGYTARAYATNSQGTSYGSSVSFTTTAAPTTVTAIVPAGSSPTNAGSVQFTVTFAASVTGLSISNFATAPSAGITGSSVSSVSGTGTTYTVTVATGSGDGTLGLTLANATGLVPSVSNVPYTGPTSYTLDKTAPGVTLSSTAGSGGSSTTTTPFAFTATFSESVTGFVAAGVTVTNGTVSGFNGSGSTYTFTVTPTTAGTANTVGIAAAQAQDAAGNANTASGTYSLTYTAPTIAVGPATLPGATQGAAYSQSLSASGGTAPYTYAITAGALPTGLTLSSGGTLSGRPTVNGSFTFTVRATDAATTPGPFSGTRSYTLVVSAPTIAVSPSTLPGTTVAVAYSQSLSANGGTAPYTYAITAGALPAGLTLSSSGTLSGTPTASGSFTFTVRATDAGSNPGTQSYTLTVNAPTVSVAPSTLPGGTQGTAYSQTLTAAGGTAPYTYALTSGALPAGLTLSSSGSLAGTPTASGSFAFTVTATDASTGSGPYTGSHAYTLAIAAPGAVSWTGSASTDWFTAGNWTPAAVPTIGTDVTIPASPSGNRYPAIGSGAASARALTLSSGATLTQTGGTLDVRGNLTNNGTLTTSGGILTLGSSALANVLGSSAIRFFNLTVGASGAQLSTSAGASIQQVLTLGGNLATQGNPLTLESNASGTALVVNSGSSVVSGNVTVQRYIDGSLNSGLGYRHYSAPVSNTTVADLSTSGFTPVLTQSYNTSATPGTTTPFPNVFAYDQARLATVSNNYSAFDKGFVVPQAGDALTPGRGYAVNISAGQLVDFVGTAGNGDLPVSLARTSGSTATDGGWALVGNPYPAPLNLAQVAAADRQNLDAAVYVVQSTGQYAGGYRSYVNGQSTTSSSNPLLPVAQGFFVRVSSGQTSGSLTFRNSQRATTFAGQSTFQRTTTDPRPALRLTLRGNSLADGWVAYAEAGATAGFDGAFDAAKLPNPTGLNLSSTTGPEQLAIDGRPAFTAATVLPLAVGVPAAGTYTLTADALDNLPAGLTATLRDAQTGSSTVLVAGSSYAFSVSAAQASSLLTGRFTVTFSPSTPLATAPAALAAQVSLYPNPTAAGPAVTVAMPGVAGASTTQVELLNALGQVVLHRQAALPASGTSLTLPTTGLATGLYLVRLTVGETTVTKRLTIQ